MIEQHGWYSQTLSENCGDAIYEVNGKPAAISWVTDTEEKPDNAPNDLVYIGVVGKFIECTNNLPSLEDLFLDGIDEFETYL